MDVLAVNPVLNQLQEIVVRWDDKLAECVPSLCQMLLSVIG